MGEALLLLPEGLVNKEPDKIFPFWLQSGALDTLLMLTDTIRAMKQESMS